MRIATRHSYPNKSSVWDLNGIRHREDRDQDGYVLPAFDTTRYKAWYRDGKWHRSDRDQEGNLLPAVRHMSGRLRYFIDGTEVPRFMPLEK